MSTKNGPSVVTAPTRFIQAGNERYAYRRFGSGSKLPLLCLQHFSLQGQRFHVVVIGGGINGVAVARECARAGKAHAAGRAN